MSIEDNLKSLDIIENEFGEKIYWSELKDMAKTLRKLSITQIDEFWILCGWNEFGGQEALPLNVLEAMKTSKEFTEEMLKALQKETGKAKTLTSNDVMKMSFIEIDKLWSDVGSIYSGLDNKSLPLAAIEVIVESDQGALSRLRDLFTESHTDDMRKNLVMLEKQKSIPTEKAKKNGKKYYEELYG